MEIRKENQVLMVNKTTSFKKQGKPNKGNFKKGGKKVVAPPKKPKAGPKPDTVCYYCKEKGHWKHNCPKYLADLKSGLIKKKDTTSGRPLSSSIELLRLRRSPAIFLLHHHHHAVVLEANRLGAEAQSENTCLKDELKKLKKKMKDEQEARHKAFVEADEKEGALRESIGNFLSIADMHVDRTNKLRVDSMSDALIFANESSKHIKDLLKKTKGALSRLFSMMFLKLDQNKTLGEMADTFFTDSPDAIEIPSTYSRVESSLNSSAIDESELVRRLRDQISRLNKDIAGLHTMTTLVKKKSKITAAIEQHALDCLRVATESLRFTASNESEENKRIHEKIAAMTDITHPKCELWSNRSKAIIVAKFEYRVEKVHYYFDKYHAHLTMAIFPWADLSGAPNGLGRTSSAWSGPIGLTHLHSRPRVSNPKLSLSRDVVVAIAVAELPRPSPAVSGDEIGRIRLASRQCTRWSASIWVWRPPPLAPKPTTPRVCTVRATIGCTSVFLDVVVLPCASLVRCWSSRARRTPGLAAAWRCRGQAVPPCRHGGTVVLCSR
ncbi:hypothetical protein QYE76_063056 [Lolium multiflorum]|uniref:CCHC-type domain-containing protein n=1 Tax=Lolium multiflorum TaxID=4521 RepID=A0AAD8S5E3_LOLMU|nr:hypothetical protein QYE76_063056 [Lolium multiflorum]